MKVKEYHQIPKGHVGNLFIKKRISNIHFNKEIGDFEGCVELSVETFHEQRQPSLFERAFFKAGINPFALERKLKKEKKVLVMA